MESLENPRDHKCPTPVVMATAGLGTKEFLAASIRVISQSIGFGVFTNFTHLTNENIELLCPVVSKKYSSVLNSTTTGFGYMAWKAELAHMVMQRHQGNVLYLWVDAGCEMFATPISKLKFKIYLKKLKRDGFLYFTLDTPESFYTKHSLFSHFPSLNPKDKSPQAQTTFFGLYGEIGRSIAERWFEVVSNDLKTINEEENFSWDGSVVKHRHDQSVFSLVLKELGLKPNIRPLKRDSTGNFFLRKFKYLVEPVLASRNRTGKSLAE